MDHNQTTAQTQAPLVKIPPEVKSFLESLMTDAGVEAVDEAMKEQMVLELYSRLDNFIATTIIKDMPAEHTEEFIRLNEEGKSREEIDKFMREKIPNCEELFAKAFIDFRDIYLGNAGVTAPTNES